MCIKKAHTTFAYDTYYLGHWNEGNERTKTQATIECGFTLKHMCDMIRTYSQMHRSGKYSQQSSIIDQFY